ncbi:MAG: molybdopterin molybdotransferase MoeA [Novosphingobium sp.]|uniref:molybdopterin molybdotransferase MoeA n=1 Tax=Novosphingobium sp. TaxID=1874826 RepID=UPI003B9DB8A7
MKTPPLPLAEAQARLLALAPSLPTEHCAVGECLGFYLAEPLRARRTQPAAPLSAMDGYALRSVDLPGPWRVVGESAAGHPFGGAVSAGEAVRISTGAIVPQGADMVLLQEDASRDGDEVRLTGEPPAPPERHIRPAGMDFTADANLIAAGTRIGPAQIALAIAGGHSHLPVRRRLKITVIDSGDELVLPGHLPDQHQLPASNGPMLCAMAATLPVDIRHLGPIPDRLDALAASLESAGDADVVVTSGGASVGDHDLVRPALEAVGASIDFWRVGIKPGKPLLVARRGDQVILGLPGNPASAFVTAFLFLLPLLRATLGAGAPLPRTVPAKLAGPMAKGGSRMEFLRGVWDGVQVTLDPLQDSGALSPLARANALVVRAAGAEAKAAGTDVPVYLLENGGIA